MALDELKAEDEVFKDNGITYVIEKEFFNQVKPIKIDYNNSPMGSGFSISSSFASGGACGQSCSC